MKILIADDHAIVRRGLKDILYDEFPYVEIAEAKDSDELLKKVMKEDWSMVISDLSMPGKSGLDALPEIRKLNPRLPVLILSIYSEEQYAIRVLKAGAAGYLNKDLAPAELVKAIHHVLLGKKYITPSIAEKLADSLSINFDKLSHEYLSNREFEVFKLLASGKSVSEISNSMFLGIPTISTYRSRILAKMNIKTNAGLTQYAIEYKII